MNQNKLQSLMLCLLFYSNVSVYPVTPETIHIIISEDKTMLSEWEIPEELTLDTLESKIGTHDRTNETEDSIKYIWDHLGIVAKFSKNSKFLNKLTVFYATTLKNEEPKQNFKGKMNFFSSDPNQKVEATYKGWICRFKLGNRSLYGICKGENRNLEQIDILSK
ncbi:Hypothetical protein LBF_0208 [Leptospira biflexa serovar Patoc strain 'Patoc 1 (Ames)']|uniref:DUF7738 domain-containing protein n=1 Tax=Leptospira biflexa serovar Patoc (strain Patoc 1 / ATCC 23582 / Paris) TaxID=456481 RepID=B0SKB7_LEPBP|nr:hypothetical protein [Leptospira biflexa]ABZ92754.1 Hypothetical protein LBF_0208 [Leptospira biflexa serovar Patoc strain 'Patoc 1 (Ames)']ABZ96358.1 Hypothetical protein; putative signal peptide [Leptospira biflexa serovar Patoc strain 'Patoc 1 (Paris)']